MSTVVIEHVPLSEVPAAWLQKLPRLTAARVSVRIEEESPALAGFETDDPAFGIWRDRQDMADVAAHVRSLRQGRFGTKPSGPDA